VRVDETVAYIESLTPCLCNEQTAVLAAVAVTLPSGAVGSAARPAHVDAAERH
jgi:hypothetical protein